MSAFLRKSVNYEILTSENSRTLFEVEPRGAEYVAIQKMIARSLPKSQHEKISNKFKYGCVKLNKRKPRKKTADRKDLTKGISLSVTPGLSQPDLVWWRPVKSHRLTTVYRTW